MENNDIKKIKFFKKVWYSITKPSKYENMKNEGIWSAVKYFFSIVALVSIILAIIATILQVSVVKKAITYLNETIPEISFKDNKLSVNSEKATILNDDKFIEYFGNVVVIDPLLEKQKAIDQYNNLVTEKNNVIIFLSDQYIVITKKYDAKNEKEEGILNYKYADISSKYISDNSIEYNKKSIISYIEQKTSYAYYIAQFFTFYLGMITVLYVLYILLIAASLWIVTKISKTGWTFKNSIINTIYASTLSIIIYVLYMIISYFLKFTIPFMDVISIIAIFLYLSAILKIDKAKKRKEN